MDAHCIYERNYISNSLKYSEKFNADNVGGMTVTLPGNNTLLAESIALALAHPFGVGNSFFRIGSKQPKYVDTVPFGFYNREVFDDVGLFDEDLIRNQDDELNLRLIKKGGKILFVPEIISYYHVRSSLKKLWAMYFQYGYFKPLVAKKVGAILTWRQIVPALFVTCLISTGVLSFLNKYFLWLFLFAVGLYVFASLFFSLSVSIKKKTIRLLPFLSVSFATLHFGYGFGYLRGLWDFIICKRNIKKEAENFSTTR